MPGNEWSILDAVTLGAFLADLTPNIGAHRERSDSERREEASQRREDKKHVKKVRAQQKAKDKNEEDKPWEYQYYEQGDYIPPSNARNEIRALFDEAISIMNSIQADVRAAAQAQGEEKVSEFPAPQLIGELKNRIMRMCRNKEISADDAFNYGRATRWFVKKMRKTNDKEERQKLIKEYNEIIDPLIDIDPCSKGLFWAVTLAILATMLVAAPVLTATVSLSTASKAVLASGFAGAIFGGSTTRDKIDTTKTTEAVDKATPTDVPLPRPSSTEAVHKAIPTDAQSPRPSSTGGAAAPSKKTILYKI